MPAVAVIGSQWGDEGKGKIVDLLSARADVIVRFQGGANAGHTIVFEGKKIIFHHLPSGVLYPDKVCVLGHGMVIDPVVLVKEMENLKNYGIEVTPENLKISDRAHLVMPYHKIIDNLREQKRASKIGTTGRGIGPAYEDKIARRGIRFSDYLNPSLFKEKLKKSVEEINKYITRFFDGESVSFENIYEEYSLTAEILKNHIIDTTQYLNNVLDKDAKVLLEGAQGTFLDIDQGTYPYVTSSNTSIGYAFAGSGINPHHLSGVIGVVKAYTTRVGGGPFPTELNDKNGEFLREKGKEFGSTTGRPRRCGWLDLVVVKRAALINGFTSIALTKLDVLTGLKKINLACNYALDGNRINFFPATAEELQRVKPEYIELEGWDELKKVIKNLDDLPPQCLDYIKEIEREVGVDVSIISISADRKDTIFVKDIF